MPRLRQVCPPCHQRKVKCDVAKVDNGLCSNCVKRGLQCPGVEEIPPRKRRRGVKVNVLDDLYPGSPSSTSTPSRNALVLAGTTPVVRAEASLAKIELASEFARSMVSECRVTHAHFHKHLLPNCDLQAFPHLSAVSPVSEIVARCFIALGARHTSHPAIVGTLAPSLSDPSGMFIVGARREGACRELVRILLERYDELALWRKPSLAALQAAAFVYLMVKSVSSHDARPIAAAAIDNARRLVDSPDTPRHELEALQGRGAVGLLWIDSIAAVECGSLPCITDHDLEESFTYLGEIVNAKWEDANIELAMEGSRIRLCREFATVVHRPFLRGSPLNTAKINTFMDHLGYHQVRCFDQHIATSRIPPSVDDPSGNALRQSCVLILMTVDVLRQAWSDGGDLDVLMLHMRSESLARQALKMLSKMVDNTVVLPRNTKLAVRTFGILEACPHWVDLAMSPSSQPGEALTLQEQTSLFKGLQLAGWCGGFAEGRLGAFLSASSQPASIDDMIGSHVATMAAHYSPIWGAGE